MNPYDVVGKVHNKGMDFVLSKLNPDDEAKYEKITELVSQFLVELTSKEEQENSSNFIKDDFVYGYIAVGKTFNLVAINSIVELNKMAAFNEKQACFINALLNVSDKLSLDYEGTLKVLMNIEEQILASDLTPEEKQIPLIVASITKYSVKYYLHALSSDCASHKIADFIDGDLSSFKFPWKADGKGAIAGAIGGIGTGVVIGAIGGAIGSSVAALLGLG
ncbi:MAG: hypothetical protein H6586_06770 [Flavobacteriales bacterium]|nr:hypothetical protein [Flavobacteriales bacterium]